MRSADQKSIGACKRHEGQPGGYSSYKRKSSVLYVCVFPQPGFPQVKVLCHGPFRELTISRSTELGCP
jgi:hypothetical protein